MKSYKLIKEYPGSSSLGTIFHIGGFAGDVSKYPEFFEEVVENDYEIVSYWSPRIGDTKYLYYEGHEDWDNISKSQCHSIHSVKRLSDGEVFTVGDRVRVTECGSIKTVDSIAVENISTFLKNGAWIFYNTGVCHLDGVTKVKQPIFLTHDGKDIFAGDKLWWVNKKTFYSKYFVPTPSVTFFSDLNAYFLTKEAAEDYVEKNKGLFTTDDGVEVREGDMIYVTNIEGSYKTSFYIDEWRPQCDRKSFSTEQALDKYILNNKPAISIKEFWEISSMRMSNTAVTRVLEELVKNRIC
tara:strand:- start:7167 stop:8054 length:888 start_codon:yes stop_codon:yes gene_type:complete